jgi:hypothetical protein
MIGGFLVITEWNIFRLMMEETASSYGGAAMTLAKQPWTVGKGWSSNLLVWRGATKLLLKKRIVTKLLEGSCEDI